MVFAKWKQQVVRLERYINSRVETAHKRTLITDYALFILILLLLSFYRPDTLMIVSYVLLYSYLFFTGRRNAFYHLSISSVVALIWVYFARNEYGYNQDMLLLFGLNTYPLFAWASGLFVGYLIYAHWEHKLGYKKYLNQLILFLAIYAPLLIFVETLGYHLFNIQNLATAVYDGLPLCDCIHAPGWMQFMYFALGPIYFTICRLSGLESPLVQRSARKKTKMAK